jgi:chemotaxis family two-component system sensor kinase Cph1
VDASYALADAMQNLKMRMEETGAKVEADPLPTVLADKDQLIQVFQNLIGNALKFKGENEPEIRISVQESQGFAQFCVADNGIGFDSKHADRIFVLFQRLNTRDKYEGTGIGLAICKKIVERHGGHIWAESQLGKGSSFFFTFPLVPVLLDEPGKGAENTKEEAESFEERASRLI